MDAKTIFNEMAASFRARGDHERATRMEIAREYFTNPTFREWMEEATFEINETSNART